MAEKSMEKYKKSPFWRIIGLLEYRSNLLFRQIFFRLFPNSRLNLPMFLDSISDLGYIVIKKDVPYVKDSFPKNYPMGKDLDLLATRKDFDHLVEELDKFAKKNSRFELKIIKEKYGVRYRFIFLGHLHYQIDVCSGMNGLNKKFIEDSIHNRIQFKNTFIPQKKYEIIYRIYNIFKDRNKKHHISYIIKNKNYLDYSFIKDKKALNFTKKLLKEHEKAK